MHFLSNYNQTGWLTHTEDHSSIGYLAPQAGSPVSNAGFPLIPYIPGSTHGFFAVLKTATVLGHLEII